MCPRGAASGIFFIASISRRSLASTANERLTSYRNSAIKMKFCDQILDMMKMMLTITSAWVFSTQVMVRGKTPAKSIS
jgi:hypothetical protein